MVTKRNDRVVVLGGGVVSSLGHCVDDLWSSILEGRTCVDTIPTHWGEYYESKSKYWSPLNLPDYSKSNLRRSDRLTLDVNVLNSVVASDEAVRTSGLTQTSPTEKTQRLKITSNRTGIFVGTGLGCVTSTLDNFAPHLLNGLYGNPRSDQIPPHAVSYLRDHKRVSPVASLMSMGNSIAAQLAIRYDITGPVETNLMACSSGAYAIHRASECIRSGDIDVAICGGSEYYGDHSGAIFMAFDRLGTLAHADLPADKINRPFDKARSGFLFSQGASCFVVLARESYATAIKRPIAELKASGCTTDAHSLVAISKDKNSIRELIDQTLTKAGLTPDDIDYVSAHGTSTNQNDLIEGNLIAEIFGERPAVNSAKSYLGHTIAASGAIEMLLSVKVLETGTIYRNLNLSKPICPIWLPKTTVKMPVKNALTQNFGFGGHNVAIVVSNYHN